MRRTLGALVAILLSLGVLDAAWLILMASRFYGPQLGGLLVDDPVWPAAIGFYLLYAGGILFLVVQPVLIRAQGLRDAALRGALLGLVAYGTYDLTNLATLRDWPPILTLVDMAWGSILTAVTSVIAVSAARRLG